MSSREHESGEYQKEDPQLGQAVDEIRDIWKGFIKNTPDLPTNSPTYKIHYRTTISRLNEFIGELPNGTKKKVKNISHDSPLEKGLRKLVDELPVELQDHPVVQDWKSDWIINEE